MQISVITMVDRIKDLKKKKNITNAQLSDMTGIPYGTLNKILGGETKEPSVIAIAKIAKAMHVTVDYFVTGKVEPGNGLSTNENVLLNKYRKLDKYGISAVNAILNEEHKRSTEQAAAKPEIKEASFPKIQNSKNSNTIEIKLMEFSKNDLDKESSEMLDIYASDLARQADFAVKVTDNSMKPTFTTGDILLVENALQAQSGDIAIFKLNGKCYIREYDGNKLIAHNGGYSDMEITGRDILICQGRIIGILEEEDFIN